MLVFIPFILINDGRGWGEGVSGDFHNMADKILVHTLTNKPYYHNLR